MALRSYYKNAPASPLLRFSWLLGNNRVELNFVGNLSFRVSKTCKVFWCRRPVESANVSMIAKPGVRASLDLSMGSDERQQQRRPLNGQAVNGRSQAEVAGS
jgi:hypothetical protein